MKIKCKTLLIGKLSTTSAFDGGLFHVLGKYIIKLLQLIILLLIWKSILAHQTTPSDMTIDQVLTYTLFSSILAEQLNVVTPASTAFWEGNIASRYLRPMPVLMQLSAETAGQWLPGLLLYSLPVLFIAPCLGVSLRPANLQNGLWFIPSLALAISLGFALDYLYASLVIYIKNANWTMYMIRRAIDSIFSGALIPFALLPWGIGNILRLLPLGAVAGAPLAIYTGSGEAGLLLPLQLVWNIIIWIIARIMFRKSQERMVSYGG